MSAPAPQRRCTSCRLAALIATLLAVSSARSDEPAVTGVVVLRNGNVLQGAVSQAGDCYIVSDSGASLQIPVEQVEMTCASLADAYELRRQSRVGASADAHLELARWCLRHELLDQAAREVLDARTRDSGHPALASMDLQIRQALEAEVSRRERAKPDHATNKQGVEVEASAPSPAPSSLNPSVGAQTQFVRSIQPMLIHNCATGGCHQVASPQQMQLDRWALEGNGNPELIRRNLYAVLAQISAEDPPSSPLIMRARQSHGLRRDTMSRPLATYQAALLLNWLNEAAGVKPAVEGELPASSPSAEDAVRATSTESDHILPASDVLVRTEASDFKPCDAFDAEIFNRQSQARTSSGGTIPGTLESAGDEQAEGTAEKMSATGQSPAE
jgi:hypothetical protein